VNDDILKGCAKIAAHLNDTPRATYHKLESGLLPCFKIGGTWYARKSTLNSYFDQLERKHAQPADAAE